VKLEFSEQASSALAALPRNSGAFHTLDPLEPCFPKNVSGKNNFGSQGYEDYTIHHDPVRRASYRQRHKAIKLKDGRLACARAVKTQPAFWALELLW
jgi:hypothetical protein